ncbi:MAG: hypothetical protein V7661_18965, partial [Sulfitobacter sp.]
MENPRVTKTTKGPVYVLFTITAQCETCTILETTMRDHSWLLEVLEDIANYAQLNGLSKLSEVVLDAEVVAVLEIYQAQRNTSLESVSENDV